MKIKRRTFLAASGALLGLVGNADAMIPKYKAFLSNLERAPDGHTA